MTDQNAITTELKGTKVIFKIVDENGELVSSLVEDLRQIASSPKALKLTLFFKRDRKRVINSFKKIDDKGKLLPTCEQELLNAHNYLEQLMYLQNNKLPQQIQVETPTSNDPKISDLPSDSATLGDLLPAAEQPTPVSEVPSPA